MTDRHPQCGPEEFASLFLRNTPLLDVRAEVEYARGAFPSAINVPILTTEERHEVGIAYKQRGQQAAIDLGHDRVHGAVREQRIEAWRQLAQRHPDLRLYCWRGGLRSALAQQWLAERGVPVPRVRGGYKALRAFLLDRLTALGPQLRLLRVCGRTGSGKTELLADSPRSVDLEELAMHRGSSFGRRALPPPNQVDFEHRLAIALLQRSTAYPDGPLVIEDEGSRIGAVSLPEPVLIALRQAPRLIVECTLEERVERVLGDYVVGLRAEIRAAHPDGGDERFRDHLLDSLYRIRRRLGDERYRELRVLMESALDRQLGGGGVDAHRAWIERLLREYYDRMYDYQLQQDRAPVLMRASYAEVREYLRSLD